MIANQRDDVSNAQGSAPRDVEDLGSLVTRLRGIAAALPEYVPDPADGAAWVRFEAAMAGLHGALVALAEIEGAPGAPRNPSPVS